MAKIQSVTHTADYQATIHDMGVDPWVDTGQGDISPDFLKCFAPPRFFGGGGRHFCTTAHCIHWMV